VKLDDVVAQLYALPPEEFTAARTEAVTAAKTAGDRDLAKQIGALRRPTVGAWLVNLLAHQRPDLIGDLLALGDALRAAQRNLRGDELRELSAQRRTMVTALAREARALAVAAGRGVRAALPLDEVQNTLTAALADAEVAEEVRLGRLVKPVEYAGFGEQPRPQLRLVQGGAATSPAKPAPATSPPAVPPKSRDLGKSGLENEPQISKIAKKRIGPGAGTGTAAATRAAEAAERQAAEREAAEREAEREAAEEAAEREAAERRAAEREAARQEAAEQRRRQQAAHRELLAARTALAEAEAERAAAEKAVRAAKRRVEKALTEVEKSKRD
jgi:hypothetical protein